MAYEYSLHFDLAPITVSFLLFMAQRYVDNAVSSSFFQHNTDTHGTITSISEFKIQKKLMKIHAVFSLLENDSIRLLSYAETTKKAKNNALQNGNTYFMEP